MKTLSRNGTYAPHQRGPLKPCIKYCSSVAWKHQTTHLTGPPAQLSNLLNFHQSSPNRKPQALIQHIPQKHLTSSSLYSNLFICQKINWEQPQFIGLHLHGPVCAQGCWSHWSHLSQCCPVGAVPLPLSQ